MLIIGSRAIKYWFPLYDKVLNDTDFICEEIPNIKLAYCEYYKCDATDYIISINKDTTYIDKDLLYTMKISHLAWEGKNGKWWKHLKDAVFLKNNGCVLNKKVFELLYKEWQNRFGDKSHISLNKATEMFFKDGVRREYDHDWLHEYFAISDSPAYKNILTVKNSPLCSEAKFNKLSHVIKFNTALEEIFVVAFERNISIPNAYKALVTKMTKGFWNLFLIENAQLLLDGFTEEKKDYIIKVRKLKEEQK